MTVKPILFSAPMIRALLAGRKTQTRRLLKRPSWAQAKGWPERIMDEQDLDGRLKWFARETGCLADLPIPQPGDLLWVKETWTHTGQGAWTTQDTLRALDGRVEYRATNDIPGAAWFPSIFMFRKFSRLTLRVTDVRVQRLQEISEADAQAEGIEMESADPPFYYVPGIWPHSLTAVGVESGERPAQRSFSKLWDLLNADRAPWADNPWVAAYTFEVHQCNVDQMEAAA
ncbi:hypothetical protein FIU89_11310 [Roseovarius sp. THAF27]|uniref:hypothetical protein n=1 Tax=Roseovarius sp. THAF27 TaxID=2587850 RepID=UPI0012693587|nr:hypothetical protein [Roseovarius sp. THAF27]QFT81198.1 hypothetical protein FIU89_11310 [Roseovarius sp. THAF27]